MGQSHELSIELSEEAAEFVRRKVASGEYASESEVLSEGISLMKDEAEERERWEREIIVPAYNRLMANPDSAIPLKEVEERLAARRRLRSKAS